MASTTIMRRPSLLPAQSRMDEELINRSLLDSLDEQADAEPLSSSDSEAPTATTGTRSTTSSSVTSPGGPYGVTPMRSQFSRSDSPSLGHLHNKHTNGIDSYLHHIQHSGQSMYTNMHPNPMATADDVTPRQLDKIGMTPTAFRTPNGYGALANGRVQDNFATPPGLRSFQDTLSSSFTAENLQQGPLPGRTPQLGDGAPMTARRYDFANGPPGVQHRASFSSLADPFAPNGVPQHAGPKMGAVPGQRQQGGYSPATQSFGAPLSSMQSQTPFGPHLPAGGVAPNATLGPAAGPVQSTQQEEISTIFVVGFPDDMQEREFQNMFTFSPGFEAATLKIPNKELTSYGSGAGNLRSAGFGYSGSSDPYNLVTMNQGGVLVDNGRDGTTTSWAVGHDDSHFGGPNMTPRKQIIGFAKFRSRQEALDAREVLQGRRVDAEKGAMLKAEMAKKNLHTKRGVGQVGGPPGPAGAMSPVEGLGNFPGLNGMGSPTMLGAEALSARERELGALGAMGFGAGGQRREQLVEDERSLLQMQGGLGARGARERAEEDEREREHRRREKEFKLRSTNSSAFDAFHSVQQSARNPPPNPLLSNAGDELPARFNMNALGGQDTFGMNSGTDPWTQPPRDRLMADGAVRKVPSSLGVAAFAMRRGDSQHGSPTNFDEFPSGPNSTSSQDGFDSDVHSNPDTGPFSPPMYPQAPVTLLKRGAHVFRPRAASPTAEHGHGRPYYGGGGGNQPSSSASSTSGSSQIGQDDFAGAVANLNMGQHGEMSPQLPSPVSGSSSGSAQKGNVDQNPPINTLYVGNLPSSPLLSYSNQLEENLKALFSRCQGFRKLCFRQKANGPMCFVEFDDVHFATKALNDLYGHTLDGMIKNGGIRLSYSKNPLGVRPPNGVTIGNGLQPHQTHQTLSSQNSPYLADNFPRGFQGRVQIDQEGTPIARNEKLELPRSPPVGPYSFGLAAPPPRFSSTSPNGSFSTPAVPFSSTAFPRVNPQGYSLSPPGTNGGAPFSSFGFSSQTPSLTTPTA